MLSKFWFTRSHEQDLESRQELLDNQERLRVALEAGGMGTFQWDILSQELTWSPGVEVLHGVGGGITSGSIMLLMEAIHPEDRERFQLTITKSLRSGAPDLDADYRVLLPSGEVRWIAIKGRVKRKEDGLPATIAGVVWDVTDRKEIENLRRESEERFRLLANSSPVLIWMNSLEGCEFVNSEYLAYVGKPMEDVAGMKWAEAVHPEDREEYLGAYERAVAARDVFEAQVRLLGADGEYRWFKSVGNPRISPSGELQGYIGSSFDVDDLKVAQERIALLYEETEKAREQQEFLVKAGAKLATTLDLDETLAQVAHLPVPELGDLCVVQLLGEDGSPGHVVPAARDSGLIRTLAEFAAKYPDEGRPEGLRIRAINERRTMFYPHVDEDLICSLTASEPQRELLRRLRANSIVAVPLMVHGEPIGALTLAVTASSGRRYERGDVLAAEAFAQRAALALLNARHYTKAQETQEELRRLNAAKDEFVSMVSHELRTPITTVFSGARFLRNHENLDEQTAREVLDDIEQEAARLELIVENLLALARQEAGKQPDLGPLLVDRVVKGVVSRMQNLRPSRPFHLSPAGDAQLAFGVPIYVELVLRNLLDNADKYSPAGTPVEISALSGGGAIEVRVRDHGPGLDETETERVFEQFYRAGSANGASGTGVGLAVCRRLMESQGGKIALVNHEEGGLEACLTLAAYAEGAQD